MTTIDAVKDLLLKSGSAWILWFLGILSLASVAIVVERFLFFRARGADLKMLAEKLDGRLSRGQFAEAILDLEASGSVAGAIAAAGLRLADRGPAAAEKAMLSATALERNRLEKWLAYLGTLGNNAPFVGLFGTVVGVVGAFEKLGAGSAASANQAASQAVMSSIAEALVATAVGILVALPSVAAYNYFQRRITSLLSGSEVLSNLVLAYLCDESREKAAA